MLHLALIKNVIHKKQKRVASILPFQNQVPETLISSNDIAGKLLTSRR